MDNKFNPNDINTNNLFLGLSIVPDWADPQDMSDIFHMYKECTDQFDFDELVNVRRMLGEVLLEEVDPKEFDMYSQMLLYVNQRIDKVVNDQVKKAIRGEK